MKLPACIGLTLKRPMYVYVFIIIIYMTSCLLYMVAVLMDEIVGLGIKPIYAL